MKINMKRLSMILAGALLVCSLLTGCGNQDDHEKMCRLEIISTDDLAVIKTLDNITQEEAAAFLDVDHDMDIDKVDMAGINVSNNEMTDAGLIPEYRIVLYQEKTKTMIKSNDEYGEILEFITYKDSDCVRMNISVDAGEDIEVPDDFISVYYEGTDVFFDNLNKAID